MARSVEQVGKAAGPSNNKWEVKLTGAIDTKGSDERYISYSLQLMKKRLLS
jgi:hypothetical protein